MIILLNDIQNYVRENFSVDGADLQRVCVLYGLNFNA